MKRLFIFGSMALSVLLALACSLASGNPTEEIRRQAIAILSDQKEEELVRDFIVVTPPPTFTVTPTPPSCPDPVSLGTYNLSVFNDQSGVADTPQFANGLPDGQNTRWEGDPDAIRYWSYSLENVISGMITHTLVYTPEGIVNSVELYVHRDRFVSVDEPGWVRVCAGQWNCSFSAEVGSVMYALAASGSVEVDGATIELTNGCEYPEVVAALSTPTLTPTGTPTATIESGSQSQPTPEPTEQPTEAPTDVATPVPPPPTLPLPSPTLPLPTPTLPLPTPTLPPSPTLPPPSPTLPPPSPTSPPSSPPTDTPVPTPIPLVAFSTVSYSIAESGGFATITVILNTPSSLPITVNYAVSNGTAAAGSEYVPTSGTLTFNPGVTSQSFTVPIINDLVIGEGNLVANLLLSNPINAALGTPNPATLTMIDLCTLPDAITSANTDTAVGDCAAGNGDDTITILLTGAINLTAILPNLSSNIVIDGPGAGNLTIQRSSGGNYRIFTVTAGNTVTINGVTVSNGLATDGGGIFNGGTLTLNNTIVSGNTSSGNGGGITNVGNLTVNNSTISGNSAAAAPGAGGGGIYNPGGSVTVNNSTISGNTADEDGGGISNLDGTLILNNTTIDSNSSIGFGVGGGIFNNANGSITVNGGVISNNDTTSGSISQGGGIYNEGGPITLNNTTIRGNTAVSGGGINNLGPLTINDSLIDGNTANVGGGGITNRGTLTINRSTISNNVAGIRSGGISNETGTTTLVDSTVNNNRAVGQQAGGLRNGNAVAATMRIVNSTISNNSAGGSGAGLYVWSGTVTLSNSTVNGNTAGTLGGGIRRDNAGSGTVILVNTIVAGNNAGTGPDCEGNLTSQDFNLIQNTANCTVGGITTNNLTGIDPQLGPLQNNGGPTNTHALSGTSPAIDVGSCAGTTADQRGFPRPVDKAPPNVADGCDMGAFEVQ